MPCMPKAGGRRSLRRSIERTAFVDAIFGAAGAVAGEEDRLQDSVPLACGGDDRAVHRSQ
jgi:hypothetical protein